jgi:hypothetical protein
MVNSTRRTYRRRSSAHICRGSTSRIFRVPAMAISVDFALQNMNQRDIATCHDAIAG